MFTLNLIVSKRKKKNHLQQQSKKNIYQQNHEKVIHYIEHYAHYDFCSHLQCAK